MAEEKCEILENQLSAMKRLFLQKMVAKEKVKVDVIIYQNFRVYIMQISNIEPGVEINQLYEKSVEKLLLESDSENAVLTNKENVKNSFQKKPAESLNKV